MLRIKIELHSNFYAKFPKEIFEIDIVNDTTGTLDSGNYEYYIESKFHRIKKEGKIKNFPRKDKRSDELLLEVLKDYLEKGHKNE